MINETMMCWQRNMNDDKTKQFNHVSHRQKVITKKIKYMQVGTKRI